MLPTVLTLPFVAAGLVALFGHRAGSKLASVALAVPLAIFAWLVAQVGALPPGGLVWSHGWIAELGLALCFRLDGWSLLFALLIAGIGALVLWSGRFDRGPDEDHSKFGLHLLRFMVSMLGVVFADNLLGLYIFCELTSRSSFLRIAYWHERDASREGA